jgi:hypothetical protein
VCRGGGGGGPPAAEPRYGLRSNVCDFAYFFLAYVGPCVICSAEIPIASAEAATEQNRRKC